MDVTILRYFSRRLPYLTRCTSCHSLPIPLAAPYLGSLGKGVPAWVTTTATALRMGHSTSHCVVLQVERRESAKAEKMKIEWPVKIFAWLDENFALPHVTALSLEQTSICPDW